MPSCSICGTTSEFISESLPLCLSCIRSDSAEIDSIILESHRRARKPYNLPPAPPKNGVVTCPVCGNSCGLQEGEEGFCGIRFAKNGHLKTKGTGWLDWYRDPLPTNCVASFCCAGCTESGFPSFSRSKGPEFGYKNLAVFFRACSFDCLFCQNEHFRASLGERVSPEELCDAVDTQTTCVCFFGGDPSPQINHCIRFAEKLLVKGDGILRICWETNGSMQFPYIKKITEIALKTGGCIKFDLKAYDETLNRALCGVSNKTTLDNFAYVAHRATERPNPPLLIASTLLMPGYIDGVEIRKIASFIAGLNPAIPYSLLCFYPHFFFKDLPITPRELVLEAQEIAADEGIENLNIGNKHLVFY